MAISSGVDMTTVQGIAGHSDMEMTAHYSKFIDIQGHKALGVIENKIVNDLLT
jgi:site-specific recombinase XerD